MHSFPAAVPEISALPAVFVPTPALKTGRKEQVGAKATVAEVARLRWNICS